MNFDRLQAIKRTIDKKTVSVFSLFNDELNAVKGELNQKAARLPAMHPKYAGQAHWARLMKRRVERSMMVRIPPRTSTNSLSDSLVAS